MSRPPNSTLIIQNASSLAVVGIDTQFFNVNELLRGIKNIPDGHHFFHYSEVSESGESMRYGKWFHFSDGNIITVDFSEDYCRFTANINMPHSLSTDYAYMVNYPEDIDNWIKLTKFVDMEAIEEYVPSKDVPISTATPLKEENMVLLETLKDRDPSQKFEDQEGNELKYTIVQFKLPGPRSQNSEAEVTKNSLEKSWYLSELFGHDPELLLAEIQLAFLHFIILGNLCSCTQWLSLLKLILMSPKYLLAHLKFGVDFLALLLAQLGRLPVEYMNAPGLEVINMKEYTDIMENLSYIRISDARWDEIKALNKSKFGIELSFIKKVDADNFEVYDLDCYDEEDEDAPAVVMG